jgi:hypothetical protein
MKKPIVIILALVFLVFLCSATAMASPYGIDVGDQVKYTSRGPAAFGIIGGELNMVADTGFTWISFCLERNENLYFKYDWVGGLTDRAIAGGNNDDLSEIGYDTLSDESAWLYWNFSQGTLSAGGYTYTGTEQNQIDLQGLFWYLEDEVTDTKYNNQGTVGMDIWLAAAQQAVTDGWTNDGLVAVVNLYETNDHGTYSGCRQDILAAVPIPTSVLLLGAGLLGLIGIGYRRRKSTAR